LPLEKIIVNRAAQGGHPAVLRWGYTVGRSWRKITCCMGSRARHLGNLPWAWANSCSRDASTMQTAANAGNYDVAAWAAENGCLSPEHGTPSSSSHLTCSRTNVR
ncbi:unnamed protein product, partial [Laminaria digitata]